MDPFWQNREVVAALVHTPGHWISYIRLNQIGGKLIQREMVL